MSQAEQPSDPTDPKADAALPAAARPDKGSRRGSKGGGKGGDKGVAKGVAKGVSKGDKGGDKGGRADKKGAKRLHLAHEAVARFHKKEGDEGFDGSRDKNNVVALSLADAVAALYATPRAKFDETLEVAMNLGIDPRHADQQVRGTVSLPHGTGKTLRVAVFARDEKAEQARKAGADIVGAEDLAERIQKGELPFDRCIATPDMMGLVGRLGKILGPRNLMPNPKLGTVAANVTAAVEAAKGGEVQFRAEKNGVVHAGVGRMSFSESQLNDNVSAFARAVVALKPEGAKGIYVKKITLSTTMGLGVGVDVKSVASS